MSSLTGWWDFVNYAQIAVDLSDWVKTIWILEESTDIEIGQEIGIEVIQPWYYWMVEQAQVAYFCCECSCVFLSSKMDSYRLSIGHILSQKWRLHHLSQLPGKTQDFRQYHSYQMTSRNGCKPYMQKGCRTRQHLRCNIENLLLKVLPGKLASSQ